MKIIAVIPARYNSNRFPGKLMKKIGGVPLISATYRAVSRIDILDDVFVVTDSDMIYEEIKRNGANVFMSKKTHDSGSDRIAELVENVDADIIVNVQGDEPFVNREAVENLVKIFENDKNKDIDLASAMQHFENNEQVTDPNFVKVVVDKNNFAIYFSRSPIPYNLNNIDECKYYEHIGIYVFRKKALMDFYYSKPSYLEEIEKIECLRFLENGNRIKMILVDYMGIEIDTPEDLVIANRFVRDNGIKF